MGTKSTRSSGTQHNPRGVTQGNTLVDPNTGLPIDVIQDDQGVKRLAVDANINANVGDINVDLNYEEDSVHIGDPNTDTTLKINPDGSIDANVSVDAAGGDNIAIKDTDGDELDINPDGSINTVLKGATTPVIVNIAIPLANTEQSYALPADTKKFRIRARGNAKLQMSFVSGDSGTNFMTIFPGNVYEETGLDISTTTVYFQSSKASETVEILSWS